MQYTANQIFSVKFSKFRFHVFETWRFGSHLPLRLRLGALLIYVIRPFGFDSLVFSAICFCSNQKCKGIVNTWVRSEIGNECLCADEWVPK